MRAPRHLVALAGTAAAALMAALLVRWYLVDDGILPSGSGASLRNEGRARVAVALAVGGLVGTFALVVLRRRSGMLLTAGICAIGLVLGVAGIVIYPRGTNARLVSLDPATGNERWSLDMGVERIFGVRSETPQRLVLEGTDDTGRECGWRPVAVVVDLTRRKITETRETPRYYPNQDSVPKPAVAPDPTRFRIENGASIRNCSS